MADATIFTSIDSSGMKRGADEGKAALKALADSAKQLTQAINANGGAAATSAKKALAETGRVYAQGQRQEEANRRKIEAEKKALSVATEREAKKRIEIEKRTANTIVGILNDIVADEKKARAKSLAEANKAYMAEVKARQDFRKRAEQEARAATVSLEKESNKRASIESKAFAQLVRNAEIYSQLKRKADEARASVVGLMVDSMRANAAMQGLSRQPLALPAPPKQLALPYYPDPVTYGPGRQSAPLPTRQETAAQKAASSAAGSGSGPAMAMGGASPATDFAKAKLASEQATKAFLDNNAAALRAKMGFREFGDEANKASKSAGNLSKGLHVLGSSAGFIQGPFGEFAYRLHSFGSLLDHTDKKLAATTVAVTGLVAAFAGIAKAGNEITLMENKLRILGGSAEDATKLRKELLAMSVDTKTSAATVTDVYFKMERSIDGLRKGGKELTVSQEEIRKAVEATGRAAAISGSSVDTVNASLTQFGQALGGDFKSSGQEWMSVIEGIYPLAQTIAESFGVTVDELRKMSAEGVLSTDLVVQALVVGLDQLKEKQKEIPVTLGQAYQNLKDKAIDYGGDIDKSIGLTATLTETLQWTANNLDVLAVSLKAAGAAALVLFGGLPGIVAAAGLAIMELGDGPKKTLLSLMMVAEEVSGAFAKLGIEIERIGALPGAFAANAKEAVLDFAGVVRPRKDHVAEVNSRYDARSSVVDTLTQNAQDDLYQSFYGPARTKKAGLKGKAGSEDPRLAEMKGALAKAKAEYDAIKNKPKGGGSGKPVQDIIGDLQERVRIAEMDSPFSRRVDSAFMKEEAKLGYTTNKDKSKTRNKFTDAQEAVVRAALEREAYLKVRNAIESLNTAAEDYGLTTQALNELRDNGALSEEVYAKKMYEAKDALIAQSGSLENANAFLAKYGEKTITAATDTANFTYQLEKLRATSENVRAELEKSFAGKAFEKERRQGRIQELTNIIGAGGLPGVDQNDLLKQLRDEKIADITAKNPLSFLEGYSLSIEKMRLEGETVLADLGAEFGKISESRQQREATIAELERLREQGGVPGLSSGDLNERIRSEKLAGIEEMNPETFSEGVLKGFERMRIEGETLFADLGEQAASVFGPDGTLAEGLASSLTQVIVAGEDAKKVFQQLGQTILTQVVQALIQAVIQALFLKAITGIFGAGAGAVGGGAAGLGAPPSVLGGALAMADGGFVGPVRKYASGSFVSGPGGPRSDSIPAYLSNGEFVMNAAATNKNRGMLEAMNSGRAMGGMPKITINQMPGVVIDQESISMDEVVLVARREANKAVSDRAPTIIASELSNPNSKVSKSMNNNFTTQRQKS